MKLRYYKALVTSLGYGCPCEREVNDCPHREFKKLPAEMRRKKVDGMTLHELQKFYVEHQKCLARSIQKTTISPKIEKEGNDHF